MPRCLLLLLPLLVVLSACAGSPSPTVDAAAPPFAPIAFFTGRTQGNGRLKVLLARTRSVEVDGEGRLQFDGSLMLVQRIDQAGKPVRTRRWSIRSTGAGQYGGALSDAVGPVVASVNGNVLDIRFAAKGGLRIRQWLALQPGGRVVLNHLVVRKFGRRVATLDETIRKLD